MMAVTTTSTDGDRQRGSVSIWLATASLVMIVLVGLAVDLGVQVDTGAAKSAARDYLAAAGVSGSATIQGGDTLVVTPTDTYQTTFLGIIGLNRMTVTGHASA